MDLAFQSCGSSREDESIKKRCTAMLRNDSGKISMSAALAVFIVGVLAIVAAVVLLIVRPGMNNNGSTVQASTIPFAARVDRLDGDIGIARQTDAQNGSYQGWSKATVNAPVSLGDRIYTSSGSKAAIAINRKNYVRLNPGTSLDVVSLSQGHTQLALREGACVFDVGALDSGETYEVGTPSGAVDFTEPGLYQIGIDEGSDTVVSVLKGHCQVAGVAGAGEVSKGQLLTFAAAEAAEAIVSDISPDVAGKIVDDYYSYRYQQAYDGRYRNYGAYESDPYYYEQSYRRSESYRYIPEDSDIAGVEDLDENGEWQDVPSYGHCWRPRTTSSDWAPYRDGYWSDDSTLGLTWVSNERWGWAPYHYGRWAHLNQGWYWVPSEITRHTTYSPALVAFVSPRADEVGWVPLGPGDPYVPRYYDRDYQPRYAGSRKEIDRYVNETSVVNYNDASAITMVSINQFTRVITPATVLKPDPSWRETARPIVDPYAVPVVRRIAPTLEASRPVVAVPIETQQSFNRPVIMRRQPVAPSATTNIAETLKVQAVPETAVKQKLKVKNIGAVTTTQANGIPAIPPEAKVAVQTPEQRDARINALAAQAAQGNKAAKREMRQLEAQQQAQQQQELKSQRKASAQQEAAQQQQQAEQQKAEKRAARQQAQQTAAQAEQQRQAQAAQQAEQQKTQKQAARQQAAQQAEQQKAEKRAARQPAQQPAAQAEQRRQAQIAQQAEQQKAQKRAARQQAEQAAQQQAQQGAARQQNQQEQKRIQKQAQQQAAQQAQEQAQQQKQQQKQQRRAEAQSAEQNAAQPNSNKAEKRAQKAKNKNSN
ncbi:MAG: hypothetical protein DMF61_04260 [Blastocatellia bacterium AA13]|nr:MAG: hypothetical protein DMF61_04260 [Blastocatellia bacterium AA13]